MNHDISAYVDRHIVVYFLDAVPHFSTSELSSGNTRHFLVPTGTNWNAITFYKPTQNHIQRKQWMFLS